MQAQKKLYANVIGSNFRSLDNALEVRDERDAVQKCLAMRAIYFTTYEVQSVVLNGKELKGEPENHAPRCFTGIDRVYTRDEVVADLQKPDPLSIGRPRDEFARIMERARRDVANHFKKDPADSVYITGLERPGEYILLKNGEKVFDGQGRQLWPAMATPATKPQGPKA